MQINLEDWLLDEANAGTDAPAGLPQAAPQVTPDFPGNNPNVTTVTPDQSQGQEVPDVSQDPEEADVPEEKKEMDFHTWKRKFMIESGKASIEDLKNMLLDVRERDLESYERKFVEDNLQIIFLRENANIDKASKEIRKKIKEDLDHNNPATSLVNHIISTLNTMPLLNNIFIKFTGLRGMKGEMHREFIAALLGAVEVSGGASLEDLIVAEKDYSIKISTRFNSQFGNVNLGNWSLQADDVNRFLKDPEIARLEDGAPDERNALRRRVIVSSICEAYKTRAFIINVVGTDGTVHFLGWDMPSSLKTAHTEGRIIVRNITTDNNPSFINDSGDIIKVPIVKILFVQDTGEVDENGIKIRREVELMERREGQLFLVASLDTLKACANVFQGMILKSIPWNGNPEDLNMLAKCVPSSTEILLRQC